MKMSLVLVVLAACCAPAAFRKRFLRDTSAVLSRDKRWLVWKPGVNWVAMIFGIGIPVEVGRHGITLGMTMKAYYQLPNNSSYYTGGGPTVEFARTRTKRTPTRWMTYESIEEYFEKKQGVDGKACVLRAICEASSKPLDRRAGLLAEVVHGVLTPSSTDDDVTDSSKGAYHAAEEMGRDGADCGAIFPECGVDFLGKISIFRGDGRINV